MAASRSQQIPPDTPASRHSVSVNFDHRPYRLADVAKAVTNETVNGFTAVGVDDFMKHFIPVDLGDIEAIFGELQADRFHTGKRWKHLPQKGAKNQKAFNEQTLYDGWVEIATKINDIVTKKCKAAMHGIEGKWTDCNHTIPKSQTQNTASLRPDISFVAISAEKERLKEYAEAMHGYETRQKGRIRQQLADGDELDRVISQLWWLQMVGFGEFKVKTQDKAQALKQLCNYVKQAFREQLDRRFIIGFTLCYDELNIYLFDRSGVVGIETSINIHKDPEQLIQLIAGYTMLKPEKIGFDPTVKLYSKTVKSSPLSKNPGNSWTMPLPKLKDRPHLYECQWVIEIDGIKYITIRALSLIGSEMMCGRATIVWEAVRYEDFKQRKKNAEVSSLPSIRHRPGLEPHNDLSTVPFEYFAHQRADLAATRIQAAVYVQSEDNKVLSTMDWIRGGLTGPVRHASSLNEPPDPGDESSNVPASRSSNPSSSNHASATGSEGRKRSREEVQDPGEREPFQHQGSLSVRDQSEFERHARPVERKLTRILMKTRGWSLKHFRNLVELLWVFYHAIKDHKHFYYMGVLHRDISGGNVVIVIPPDSGRRAVFGCLIDLDHAKVNKHVEEKRSLFESDLTEEDLQLGAYHVRSRLTEEDKVKKSKPVFVNEATAKAAFRALGVTEAVQYLKTIAQRFEINSSPKSPIELSDLCWNLPEYPPSFESHSSGDGVRTGTLPYMSHQIIEPSPVNPESTVVHDAIHDIESFFWLMIYMALTRAGPGVKNTSTSGSLHNLLFSYFNSGNHAGLALHKGRLFGVDDKLATASTENLLEHFHDYFKDLKTLIRKWRKVLQTAYQFGAYELWTIHDYTMTLITETIVALEAGGDSPHELTQQEDDRREAYLRSTQVAIQDNVSVSIFEQLTPEKRPRPATNTQPEQPESPTPNPKVKRLKTDEKTGSKSK